MKIVELELLSDDISQTKKFYSNVLGIEPYQTEGKQMLFYQNWSYQADIQKIGECKTFLSFCYRCTQ